VSTPRTDELYNSVCFFTDEEQAVDALVELRDLARELERENAALRAAIAESEEFAKKNGETCGLKIRDLLSENAALKAKVEVIVKNYEDYKAENAALRADRDRIDYILSNDGGFFIWWNYDIDEWTPELKATRDWIDIAMKEDAP
jgi:hypothetical protein